MMRTIARAGSGPLMPRAEPAAAPPPACHHVPEIPAGKRALDLAIGLTALLVTAPLLLAAAALIRLSSPGPALYRQIRIGHGERPFTMLKLRTMRIEADDTVSREFNVRELQGEAVAGRDGIFKPDDDPRTTPIGRWLRRYSVDELPQLLNVLKGEMSLVGPRPMLPWEVELFTPEQRRRHECLPGITGLWQVSGRNRLSMPDMLALDLVYLDRRSFLLDLQILWRTPHVVLFDQGTR